MALTATAGLLGSQTIAGIIALYHPDFEVQTWQEFLLYMAYTLVMTLVNAFGNAFLPLINQFAISWSFAGFVIISITVLACASPDYHDGEFVFGNFANETGWPDGIAWLLGLLQGALALTGKSYACRDIASHMGCGRIMHYVSYTYAFHFSNTF